MNRFYRIRIDSIYLSSDGAETGVPCKLTVPNSEDLQRTVAGVSIPSASGSRVRQSAPWTSGKFFEVRVEVLPADLYEELRDLINDALVSDTSITVAGVGTPGDFSVSAKPDFNKPFSCGEFSATRVNDVVFRFETV